jgi:3-dehydroquinate synthase
VRNIFGTNRVFGVKASEQNKTIEYCYELLEKLIANDIRKDSTVVAVGGGITQDIAAFVSSVLYRGINWVFYPTTLLAQADSCIGGKSSINVGGYKNLVGTFFPPSKVFIDIEFLETLPVEAIKSGIGEILHFYMVDGNKMTAELLDDYDRIFSSRWMLKKYII